MRQQQIHSLENKILESLIANSENCLGKTGACHDEANRIVSEWVNENGITIELDNVPEWKKRDMVSKIVDKNCKEIPYEGTEINKSAIVEEVLTLMKHPNNVPKDDTFNQCVYCGHYDYDHFNWCDRPSAKIN
jgi:hypothetical protein